jgi:hypothetical protein
MTALNTKRTYWHEAVDVDVRGRRSSARLTPVKADALDLTVCPSSPLMKSVTPSSGPAPLAKRTKITRRAIARGFFSNC